MRRRNWARRVAGNPYRKRSHGWAFWRNWTRPLHPGRAGRRAAVRRLSFAQQMKRRWRARHGGLPGLGGRRKPLGVRFAEWRRRAPRPLYGRFGRLSRNGLARKLDRQRMRRHLRRGGGPAPLSPNQRPSRTQRQPGRSTPVSPNPATTGPVSGSGPGTYRTGDGKMDVGAISDEIEAAGNQEFRDPDHVHETMRDLHLVLEATQGALQRMSERVRETGLRESYADQIAETSGKLGGLAEELSSIIGGGVMDNHGS